MNHRLFVANWKMELSYVQALDQVNSSYLLLEQLSNRLMQRDDNVVLCPSFDALVDVGKKIKPLGPAIQLGAQDCSPHVRGAYTGEVSAQSLADIGVSLCIIGHSERRMYHQETNDQVFAKAKRLITRAITPLMCIGETLEERKTGKALEVLSAQVALCASVYSELCAYPPRHTNKEDRPRLFVSYEPVWAIGTGITPDEHELNETLTWLAQTLGNHIPLLYGGSIDETTIKNIAKNPLVRGFIIGYASCNIQRFKNMLELVL